MSEAVPRRFGVLALLGCLWLSGALVGLAGEGSPGPPRLEDRRATVPSPPFRHAIIFSGGSLDIHVLFGIYDAAVAAGNPPDLVIATCGAALGAAIIRAIPDPAERAAFTRSRQFYDCMRRIRYTDLSLFDVYGDLRRIAHLSVEQSDPLSPRREVPDAFHPRSIMHVDNQFLLDELAILFSKARPGAPEIVLLANRFH